MKILFLLQEFPYPPTNGIRWKAYTVLQALSRKHECHLLSFEDTSSTSGVSEFLEQVPNAKVLGVFSPLKSSLATRVRGLFSVGLPSAGRYSIPRFDEALRQALSATRYDAVHIDMINLIHYADVVGSSPLLLSVNDAVSLGYSNAARNLPSLPRRFWTRLAEKLIARYERTAYRNRIVHVVSENDKRYLERLCPSAQVEVVPLAVDTNYFETTSETDETARPVVIVPANYGLPAARAAVFEFLQVATARAGQVGLDVVFKLVGPGSNPPFRQRLSPWTAVQFLGWVEDYRKTLSEGSVVVFPETAGAGTKNRVLQAMALAKPVLMTPTAADGVGVTHGKDGLVCRSAGEFSSALISVLTDDRAARNLGASARSLVALSHNMETVTRKWEALYQSLPSPAVRKLPSLVESSRQRFNC